jgi:hypothetical protein
MSGEKLQPAVDFEAPHLGAKFRAALMQLAEACDYARDAGRDPWDFAIEIGTLTALGLNHSDLRWLASKGFVAHACETTQLSDPSRRFRPSPNLNFVDQTCFVVTPSGMLLMRKPASDPTVHHFGGGLHLVGEAAAPLVGQRQTHSPRLIDTPYWDCNRRCLMMGDRLVKQFRVPSPNQETILLAFQEEGWPPCIGDPLPLPAQQRPPMRLHDTIKSLNAKQENRLIRFRGNGTGQAVLWEPIDQHAEGELPDQAGCRRAA